MESMYHLEEIPSYIPKVLKAFPVTMQLLLMSLIISLLIGLLVTMGSLSKRKVLQRLAQGYIAFMRGIPTLVLIFLIYLGLPQIMRGLGVNMASVDKVYYIIATLSLSASANMAEMMRTSYLAVNKGQWEAAYSVGMNSFTAFRRIILPQAFGIALPTIGNNIILLFKETSLAFTVGVIDILGKARAISAANYGANKLEVYITAGLIFWAVCFMLEKLFETLEIMYTKGRKKATG